MVYRHIYWGLMSIGPNEHNMLTEVVKTKYYLVKIVSPFVYATKEEAEKASMVYELEVLDEGARIVGLPVELWGAFKEGVIPEGCPMIDVISQEDWPRYRLLRVKSSSSKCGNMEEELFKARLKPCGKDWNRLAPSMGRYPIEEVATTIIAFPDVSMVKEEKRHAGRGE